MATTAQDATIWAGDTVALEITVTDSVTGLAKSLVGAVIRWVLVGYTGLVVVDKSTSDGITVTNAAAGKFEVALDPTDTEELPPGTYTHEAEVTDALGNVSTVTTGEVTLKASYA